jgi:hypothetical protein
LEENIHILQIKIKSTIITEEDLKIALKHHRISHSVLAYRKKVAK